MEGVINNCPAFAISQEYYEQVDFALASLAAAIVARNILEHGLKRGRAAERQRPGRVDRGLRGVRGHPRRAARLPGPARRASRPARHPLLLAGRAAAVGDQRPGHRLQRGGQPAGVGHADPPRPHRPEPAAQAQGVGLVDPGRSRLRQRAGGRRACRRRPEPTRPRRRGSRRSRSSSAARHVGGGRSRRRRSDDPCRSIRTRSNRSSSACPAQARGWCSRTSHRRSRRASRRHR